LDIPAGISAPVQAELKAQGTKPYEKKKLKHNTGKIGHSKYFNVAILALFFTEFLTLN
jgi:hypothetical protein